MTDFQLFHQHSKLVRRRLANALTCTACGTALVTGLGKSDELVLRCYSCDTTITPGEGTKSKVRAIVKEHFVE
jgi:ribosomal protein S27E